LQAFEIEAIALFVACQYPVDVLEASAELYLGLLLVTVLEAYAASILMSRCWRWWRFNPFGTF